MTDKKLTDNEIIKALECCTDWCGEISCWDCPLKNTGCIHFDKLKDTLDLINRQKVEIERLNGCVKSEEEIRVIANATIQAGIGIIKAEAIKEFAEKMKEKIRTLDRIIVISEDVDSIAREMLGEKE